MLSSHGSLNLVIVMSNTGIVTGSRSLVGDASIARHAAIRWHRPVHALAVAFRAWPALWMYLITLHMPFATYYASCGRTQASTTRLPGFANAARRPDAMVSVMCLHHVGGGLDRPVVTEIRTWSSRGMCNETDGKRSRRRTTGELCTVVGCAAVREHRRHKAGKQEERANRLAATTRCSTSSTRAPFPRIAKVEPTHTLPNCVSGESFSGVSMQAGTSLLPFNMTCQSPYRASAVSSEAYTKDQTAVCRLNTFTLALRVWLSKG